MGGDGQQLHDAVSPDRWCVTKADFKNLRDIVTQAVKEGSITPTDLDPFDRGDDLIGPCIHTINEQLIQPRTAVAGNMSWALALHPEGLKCDLFITHCWQEGIYELIDRVLNSWPSECQNAYCCVLSNPQNLDISGLLQDPSESPFAKALQSAKSMLAVSNRTTSIYTRIWCVYEAFLAFSWGKAIYTARRPVRGIGTAIVRILLAMLIPGIIAFFSCPDLSDESMWHDATIWLTVGVLYSLVALILSKGLLDRIKFHPLFLALLLAQGLAWPLFLAAFKSKERRRFGTRALIFASPAGGVVFGASVLVTQFESAKMLGRIAFAYMGCVAAPLMFLLTAAGPARVLKLPFVGKGIAILLLRPKRDENFNPVEAAAEKAAAAANAAIAHSSKAATLAATATATAAVATATTLTATTATTGAKAATAATTGAKAVAAAAAAPVMSHYFSMDTSPRSAVWITGESSNESPFTGCGCEEQGAPENKNVDDVVLAPVADVVLDPPPVAVREKTVIHLAIQHDAISVASI